MACCPCAAGRALHGPQVPAPPLSFVLSDKRARSRAPLLWYLHWELLPPGVVTKPCGRFKRWGFLTAGPLPCAESGLHDLRIGGHDGERACLHSVCFRCACTALLLWGLATKHKVQGSCLRGTPAFWCPSPFAAVRSARQRLDLRLVNAQRVLGHRMITPFVYRALDSDTWPEHQTQPANQTLSCIQPGPCHWKPTGATRACMASSFTAPELPEVTHLQLAVCSCLPPRLLIACKKPHHPTLWTPCEVRSTATQPIRCVAHGCCRLRCCTECGC